MISRPFAATALLQSLARNHDLVDGNKRLALAATIAFLGLNGHRFTPTNEEAYTLVDVARGHSTTSRASPSASDAASRPGGR